MPAAELVILPARKIDEFRTLILSYYRRHGRCFPWRETRDPYAILVSEVMLQQTQTARVVPKYLDFLERFPDFRSLAAADLRAVMRVWQGLGYNRRARFLRDAAREVEGRFGGRLPEEPVLLGSLPGLGPATARSVSVFAFGRSEAFIETNVRAVFLHVFFPEHAKVPDSQLLPLVEQTLCEKDPRSWYYGLMDYGVYLKRALGNPARRSAAYARQSPFRGSLREARGELVRRLSSAESLDRGELLWADGLDAERLERALAGLMADGLVAEREGRYGLAD